MVGGLPSAEASTLAKTLGPPSASIQAESESPPGAARDVAALRVIEGNWSGLSATMDGVVIYELVGGTWTFHDGTLTATNGVGDTGRFALTTDVAAPNAFRLDPVAPSRERGGWMIFKREGDRLTLAFFDGFFKRPEDFAPAPKKVVSSSHSGLAVPPRPPGRPASEPAPRCTSYRPSNRPTR